MTQDTASWLILGRLEHEPQRELQSQMERLTSALDGIMECKPVYMESEDEEPDGSIMQQQRGRASGMLFLKHRVGDIEFLHHAYFPAHYPARSPGSQMVVHQEGADPQVPPSLAGAISLSIHWSDRMIDGVWTPREEFRQAFEEAVGLLREGVRPLRYVDGYSINLEVVRAPWIVETISRYVYYRDPAALVDSMILALGTEGNREEALRAIRRWAEDGTIDRVAEDCLRNMRRPDKAIHEEERFKHLRFDSGGGIELENYKLVVGEPDGRSGAPKVYRLMFEMLCEEGLAKPRPG